MTTDDLTPPGEQTTEFAALQSSKLWATILKICGLVLTFGGIATGVLTQVLSQNPGNQSLATLLATVGVVKIASGALLKGTTTNAYNASRAAVKTSALDAIGQMTP